MNRVATLAFFGMLSALPGFAQTNQTDSQTLQAILTEVRAIHNDVRLSQTTQLLLTELEIQQTAVNRTTQRRDDFRSKVLEIQAHEKEVAERLDRFHPEAEPNPALKKEVADMQESLKNELEGLKSQELQRSNDLQDAESSLRREQATLDNIQAQLNDVVKKLQPVSSQ
jgi:chromosome segregation ATPase